MGGGRSRGGVKIEFLPENGGFWCILGLLFTVMQKLIRSMGVNAPLPSGSATGLTAVEGRVTVV